MSAAKWNHASVKAQFRLTIQKLGQMQAKNDSEGNITRRDIATLLHQDNVGLARAKAQKLIQEDAFGDLLEVIEMHIGVLIEHFNELDQNISPSPIVVEAASSIIFAAPYIQSKDLEIVRHTLIQRLGTDFTRSAIGNKDNYVSSRVVKALSAPQPSASKLDLYIQNIAQSYGVNWTSGPRREDIVNSLSEMLDPESSSIVDLSGLRRLCAHGIPDEPAWLRPRIWKLLFGVLPALKASWKDETSKQRKAYYELVRRLLEPFPLLPAPSFPVTPLDSSLRSVYKQLSHVPPNLFALLETEPESSTHSPFHDGAEDPVLHANSLDLRWKVLQDWSSERLAPTSTPEIRLEAEFSDIPEISLSNFDTSLPGSIQLATTLLPSNTYNFGNAHPKHCSALLRLLYLHASINPGNLSPHISSLLVTLYSFLNQEIEPEDLAHVEADTFWLFEAIVGEFSELQDEEGEAATMKKFSQRLAWADSELWDDLHAKGLNPVLPHYSHRWLAPLLTHTIPLLSVSLVWDALFCCSMRERSVTPKLELLLDISTAMLIHARVALLRLGKASQRSPSLWAESATTLPLPSSRRGRDLGDAFLEGISILQLYPVEAAGGIERILQTALDLAQRRELETRSSTQDTLSLGARLKVTMWKGFTNHVSSPEESDQEEHTSEDDRSLDDGNDTETPINMASRTLTSQIATTVWRGITNQTSMEPPLTPISPLSPAISRASSPLEKVQEIKLNDRATSPEQRSPPAPGSSSIWGYAEKLKDSDAVATLAKVSSNWRARALMGSWGRSAPAATSESSVQRAVHSESGSPRNSALLSGERRGSLPVIDRTGIYSPPPRPTYFRPPRDSFIGPDVGLPSLSPTSPEQTPQSGESLLGRTKNILSKVQSPPPSKSGPRPLLLNSSTLITSGTRDGRMSSPGSTKSTPDTQDWSDVMKLKRHHLHTGSQSSVSSLSPSDAFQRPSKSSRSDWDSDTGGSSRVIPLNRRSVSPMAPNFMVSHPRRSSSRSSSIASSDTGLLSPPASARSASAELQRTADNQDWTHLDTLRSPPYSAPTKEISTSDLRSKQAGITPDASDSVSLEPTSPTRSFSRKNVQVASSQLSTDDTSESSVTGTPARSPRVRSKRYPIRPANLQIQNNFIKSRTLTEQKTPSPSTLTVEWPVDDQDTVSTPKASAFDPEDHDSTSPVTSRSQRRLRKVSTDIQVQMKGTSADIHDTQQRKISSGHRTRKISSENKETHRKNRDSAAEEGDDEGYDDLLSAYESEEGPQTSFIR